ncbi:hypothetical protein MsAg5_05560 [Methanosarcinaceae archaeon Ag5]|uniref:Immunoglobulin domain-containing protein n=1 Tax=Methanolapillus africanus TaxID=3028297 RepID=A0AAE4MIT1_9EURY|nr:hypothetical protein [Methanosarcinaceae archaeon Ag5]
MAKQNLRFTFLLLISLIAFLALVPNAAMAASIYTNLSSDYHVIEGDDISLEVRGGPDVFWITGTGFAWKYGNPSITTTLDKLYPDESTTVNDLGATITVGPGSWAPTAATTTMTINTTNSDSKNLNGMKFQVTVGTSNLPSNVATLHVYKRAEILTQPENTIAFAGMPASFTVVPKTTEGMAYQWYKSDTASGPYTLIPDATSATYTLTTATADNGYYYKVKITGQGPAFLNNWVESTPVQLTVLPTPAVAPASLGANSDDVTFSTDVTADGYEWKKVSGNILGTTKNVTIQAADLTTDYTGYYTLTVTINGKEITSPQIHLNVFSIDFIDEENTTTQYVVFDGGSVDMEVILNEIPPEIDNYEIEWFFGGESRGANNPLQLTGITKEMAGSYEFKVTGTDGDAEHSDTISIELIVLDQPTVTPANVFEGNFAIFDVGELDGLTYTWNNSTGTVSNTAQYTITSVNETDHEDDYSVTVTVGTGDKTVTATSDLLTLTVHQVPTATLVLGNAHAFVGQEVTVTVTPGNVPAGAATSFDLYQIADPDDIFVGTDLNKITPTTAGTRSYYANMTTILENDEDQTTTESNPVVLKVLEKPIATVTPAAAQDFVGETVELTVDVEQDSRLQDGAVTVTYQWYQVNESDEENPIPIAGEESSTCSIEIPDVGESYYFVAVKNEYEDAEITVMSNVVTLTGYGVPEIEITPTQAYEFDGETVTFEVESNYTETTFEWYNGDPENGGTKVEDGNEYEATAISGNLELYVVATTVKTVDGGTITNIKTVGPATLTGYTVPEIEITPTEAYKFDGETVTFEVESDYTETAFEWYNGDPENGGTKVEDGNEYEATAISGDLELYVVATTVKTVDGGTITNTKTVGPATLTGYAIPEIEITPMQAYEFDGETVTFEVESDYTETTFEWYNGDPENGGTKVEDGSEYEATAISGNLELYVVATTVKTVDGGTITNIKTVGPATLTGHGVPEIEITPTQAYEFDGETVTFEVESNYTETTFEWYNGDPENGGTKVEDGNEYEATAISGNLELYVVATTVKTVDGGTITNIKTVGPATLTGYTVPEIEITPTQAYEFVGKTAIFEVGSDDAETTFEWYNGNPETGGIKVGEGDEYEATAIASEMKLYVVATTTKATGPVNVQTVGPATLNGLELTVSPSAAVTAGNTVTFSISGLPAEIDTWEFAWFENGNMYEPANEGPTLEIQNIQTTRNGSEFHAEVAIGGDTLESNKIILTVNPVGPSGGFGGAEVIDKAEDNSTNSGSGEKITTPPEGGGPGFESKTEKPAEKTTVPWLWLLILLLLMIVAAAGYVVWKKKSRSD